MKPTFSNFTGVYDANFYPFSIFLHQGRSTIDAILTLRLLSEMHREFDRPLNVLYLDIKAAFDSGGPAPNLTQYMSMETT